MRAVYSAAKPKMKFVPAFTVYKLDGEYTRTVAKMVQFGNKKDRDGNPKNFRIEYHTVTEPRGWLVKFPKGHSIHIAKAEQMEAMGFADPEVPTVDEDGEVVGAVPNIVRRSAKKEDTVNA